MESIHTNLALYGSKDVCARTDTVFLPISEACNGTVSLMTKLKTQIGTKLQNSNCDKTQKI